jgi:hypothetical protein
MVAVWRLGCWRVARRFVCLSAFAGVLLNVTEPSCGSSGAALLFFGPHIGLPLEF